MTRKTVKQEMDKLVDRSHSLLSVCVRVYASFFLFVFNRIDESYMSLFTYGVMLYMPHITSAYR